MRISNFALLLVFALSVIPATAQQSISPAAQAPQRDAQAVAAIQRAVSELGGAALGQVRDASVQASIQILSTSANQSLSVVWEDAWGKGAPEFHRESHFGNSISVLVSGNGQPVESQGGIATKIPTLVSFSCTAVHLPGIILAVQMNNAAYSFKFVETIALNGLSVAHIQSALTTDPITSALSLQDWYFDPISGLPLRVDYRIVNTADPLNPGIVSMQFANFRSTSGILVPFRLTETGLAGEQDIVTVTSVTFNSGLSPSEFFPPAGAIQ